MLLLRAAAEDCMFCHGMAEGDAQPDYELVRPNRDKAASKATKAIVFLLLLVSAALVLIVTIGGRARPAGTCRATRPPPPGPPSTGFFRGRRTPRGRPPSAR